MNRILLATLLLMNMLTASANTISQDNQSYQKPIVLNQVYLDFSEEQWVMTATAKVIIGLDASLNKEQLAGFHTELMQKLKQLAPTGDWHITRFDRNEDKSGLEQLRIEAEVRLPDSQLAKLQTQLKAASKPGKTYQVIAIEFNASSAEIQKARSELREKIYTDIKQELTRLHKIYPEQTYFVNQINFMENINLMPMVKTFGGADNRTGIMSAAAVNVQGSNNLVMSNKIVQNAQVILGSITNTLSTSDKK